MIAIQCGQPHCIAIVVYKYCQYYIQELGYTGMQFTFIWIHRPIARALCCPLVVCLGGVQFGLMDRVFVSPLR